VAAADPFQMVDPGIYFCSGKRVTFSSQATGQPLRLAHFS
jgi:hypothetical protein